MGLIFRALAISSTVSAMIILNTLKLIADIWEHDDILGNIFAVHLCFLMDSLHGPWAFGFMFDKDPYEHTLSQNAGLEHTTQGQETKHTQCINLY